MAGRITWDVEHIYMADGHGWPGRCNDLGIPGSNRPAVSKTDDAGESVDYTYTIAGKLVIL